MAKPTQASEDYLKAIYVLQQEQGERVSTSAIADRLEVSAPAATTMIKKLAGLGLVRHERYRGVSLTEQGERAAVEVIRHHRLLEQFLAERLGVPIDDVHQEAERLEHVLSEELEERIDRELGFPTHDPHGDPIPAADLSVVETPLRTLEELPPGEEATIRRVPDRDRKLLGYLSSVALLPGASVKVLSAAPFGGPLVVLAGGAELAISRDLAALIGIG
jgi:DtxR family transcriptional regulator, Mn-dependent transcriptional regulator